MDSAAVVSELRKLFRDHEAADQRRFDEATRIVADLVRRLGDIEETVSELEKEIGGAPKASLRGPNRKTVRDRLHDLETTNEASRIAREALAQVHAANRQAWTTSQKVVVTLLAAIGAVSSVAKLFGVG